MESLAHNFVPRLVHEKCETSSLKKKQFWYVILSFTLRTVFERSFTDFLLSNDIISGLTDTP